MIAGRSNELIRPLVFKFGGACLLDVDDYVATAEYLAGRLHEDRQAVVVVSAMSGTSGNLEELVRKLNPDAPSSPAAVAISSADQLSAALLTVALTNVGIDACLLPFSRTGMQAQGNALRARLVSMSGKPLDDALKDHQVVVLPGGHAASKDGGLMMLGRNSSDLSAVVAAVVVHAAECEIFSEIPGIFTADPRLVPSARPVPRVRYDTAAEVARSGAKILHEQAIQLAGKHGLPIVCRGLPPAAHSRTIVAHAGEWQAMVMTNTRGSVWQFTRLQDIRMVCKRLAADGIRSLRHENFLIAESGADVSAIRGACGVRGTETSLRLLSVLEFEGQPPDRQLVPADGLIDAARGEHRRLYPWLDVGAESVGAEPAPRSPLSRDMFELPPRVHGAPDLAGQGGQRDSKTGKPLVATYIKNQQA
jgi:aspartate kinase